MTELLVVPALDPLARGRVVGEHFRTSIRERALARWEDLDARFDAGTLGAALAKQRQHMQQNLAPLWHELEGIAEGSDIGWEQVLAVDLGPSVAVMLDNGRSSREAKEPAAVEAESTSLYVDGPTGPALGQTFEERDLVVLRLDGEVEQLIVTVPGSLGLFGISAHGVAVAANHLHCSDVGVGCSMSAMLRLVLDEPTAGRARSVVEAQSPSAGHHLMIADGRSFVGVESSGGAHVVTQIGARTGHVHTNHYFDPALRQREAISRRSTSFARMEVISTAYVQGRPRHSEALSVFLDTFVPAPSRVVVELLGGRLILRCGEDEFQHCFDAWQGPTSAEELQ